MTTRAAWYASRYPTVWRTARKARRCDCRPANAPPCRNVIAAGEQYFDTGAIKAHHITNGLCATCANEELR